MEKKLLSKEQVSEMESRFTSSMELIKCKKAVAILKEKLMYEVDPFDFRDYESYEDYEAQYYESRFEDPDDEGYPEWYLTKDEFELLKEMFR